jgi:integrase
VFAQLSINNSEQNSEQKIDFMANKMYTTPIVCKYKNEWFVFFRYWNQSENKYITKKISRAAELDLNRIKDLKERDIAFKGLRDAREQWLKLGWNPISDPEFKNRAVLNNVTDLNNIADWTVEKAFEHALKYKKLAVKSKYDYKKSVEYFLKAAKALQMNLLPISMLTRQYIKAIFVWLDQEQKLPPKNYNKRLMHIKSLLTELTDEWNALPENPAYRLKDLPEDKTKKFVPITDEEREIIRQYLYLENYRFYIFCITIYYTGVRPDEILSFKVKDLNFKTQCFHLKPFSNVVKNKKEREVLVHDNLMQYYKTMNLEQYPPEYYIFSKNFEPGKRKTNRQVVTLLWKKKVMKELGINKFLYSLKHSGAAAFIRAGASEENVVDLLGHSSRFITRMYTEEGIEQSKLVISKTKVEF